MFQFYNHHVLEIVAQTGTLQHRGYPRRISTMIFLPEQEAVVYFPAKYPRKSRNDMIPQEAISLPRATHYTLQDDVEVYVDKEYSILQQKYLFTSNSLQDASEALENYLAFHAALPDVHTSNRSKVALVHHSRKQQRPDPHRLPYRQRQTRRSPSRTTIG